MSVSANEEDEEHIEVLASTSWSEAELLVPDLFGRKITLALLLSLTLDISVKCTNLLSNSMSLYCSLNAPDK